ncbi:matrixin family metalloprotease [Myxococcaceae bacterium JPH2]|nr:matrixin family metalloprotease [Myxococcaceae bacterium JPH2]
MLALASWVVALALGQASDPYVRSRVVAGDSSSQALFWNQPRIDWQQSSLGNPNLNPHTEFDAVRAAFKSWQTLFTRCGNLDFAEGPLVDARKVGFTRGGDNQNLVLFRMTRCKSFVASTDACWKAETCANQYDCWDDDDGTLAVTVTTYDERSGIIRDSDISFNAATYTFTTGSGAPCILVPGPDCASTDVQNTATHEIGHMVGLDHTRAAGSIMNRSSSPGELSKRVIDSGSSEFVCVTYPKGGVSQSSPHPVVDLELGHKAGCDAAGGGFSALAVLGLGVLARSRRRGVR